MTHKVPSNRVYDDNILLPLSRSQFSPAKFSFRHAERYGEMHVEGCAKRYGEMWRDACGEIWPPKRQHTNSPQAHSRLHCWRQLQAHRPMFSGLSASVALRAATAPWHPHLTPSSARIAAANRSHTSLASSRAPSSPSRHFPIPSASQGLTYVITSAYHANIPSLKLTTC